MLALLGLLLPRVLSALVPQLAVPTGGEAALAAAAPPSGIGAVGTAARQTLFATDISIEYLPMSATPEAAPIVDSRNPRFSWVLGCAIATPCPRDQVQMVYEVTTHLLLPDGSEQHGGYTSGQVYTGESLHQPLGLLSSGETKLVSDSTYAVRVRVWSGGTDHIGKRI